MARPASAHGAGAGAKAAAPARKKSSTKSAKKEKKGTKQCVPPPKLTASFVMGVQRRPVTRASAASRQPRGATLLAALLREAASVEEALVAVEAARVEAVETAVAVRSMVSKEVVAASGTQPTIKRDACSTIPSHNVGGKKRAGAVPIAVAISRACGVVARVASAREALATSSEAAARATLAQERVERYMGAWTAAIEADGVTGGWKDTAGKRQVGQRIPVGHKLRQLCRGCGVALSDEEFTVQFGALGGVGGMCDLDAYLRFACEHDATPTAVLHNSRYDREAAAAASAPAANEGMARSPASSKGSPGFVPKGLAGAAEGPLARARKKLAAGGVASPLKPERRSKRVVPPISWDEFCEMLDGFSSEGAAAHAAASAAEAAAAAAAASGAAVSAPVSSEGAWALFVKCGGSKESGLDRRAFELASAADEGRRAKARASATAKPPPDRMGPLEA